SGGMRHLPLPIGPSHTAAKAGAGRTAGSVKFRCVAARSGRGDRPPGPVRRPVRRSAPPHRTRRGPRGPHRRAGPAGCPGSGSAGGPAALRWPGRSTVRVGFPSYTADQLTEIAETVADRTGDAFDDSALEDLRRIFGYVCEEGWIDELGNGRFARSLFEKACSQRDLRVAEEPGEAADRPTTAGPVLPHRGRPNTPALEAPARPARGRRGAAARPAGARGRYRSRPVR